MKKYVLIMMLPFLAMACNGQPNTAALEVRGGDIPVATAKEMVDADTIAIIDVRTLDEYQQGHIEDATNIDYYGDDFDEQIDKLPKDKTYMVYCRSGGRSAKAMKIMQDKGFAVYNVEGGITAWKENGEDTVK